MKSWFIGIPYFMAYEMIPKLSWVGYIIPEK